MALTPPENQQTLVGKITEIDGRLTSFMRSAGKIPAAPTSGLQDPVAAGQGAQSFDQTQNIPVWSDGTQWLPATGVALGNSKANLTKPGSYLSQSRYVDGLVSPQHYWAGDRGWRPAGGGLWHAFTPNNRNYLVGANPGDSAYLGQVNIGDPGFPYIIKASAVMNGSSGAVGAGVWYSIGIALDTYLQIYGFASCSINPFGATGGIISVAIATSATGELTGSHNLQMTIEQQGATSNPGTGINLGGNGAFYYAVVPSQGVNIPGSFETP